MGGSWRSLSSSPGGTLPPDLYRVFFTLGCGSSNKPGLWPAAWMLGNLGRVGYGHPPGDDAVDSNAGMWPYSYDTCLPASEPDYMPPNTGQKYDKCSPWDGVYPGYCLAHNYSDTQCELVVGDLPAAPPSRLLALNLTPSCRHHVSANKAILSGSKPHGRGIPEIDLLEVSVSSQGVPSLSTSLQIGPASGENGWVSGKGSCHDVVAGNITTGTGGNLTSATVVNPYHGNYGVDIMSGLTNLTESFYASFHDFRLEWHLNHTIAWYIKPSEATEWQFLFEVPQEALAGCGKVGSMYRTETRPIPQAMNLACCVLFLT